MFRAIIISLIFVCLIGCSPSEKVTKSSEGIVEINVTVPANTPKDSSLSLGGDFNSWNPNNSNFELEQTNPNTFSFTFPSFPVGNVLNFKVTRGNWQTVEIAADGSNRENRRIVVEPGKKRVDLEVADWSDLTTKEAPSTIVGDVILTDIELPTFAGTRKLRVYLPPDYHKSNESYPVIYMTDAQNLFDAKTANSGEWQMDELMESYDTSTPELLSIVVGIDHAGENRRAEYLPIDGKGEEFSDWLINELKPKIDKSYRTKPEREHTTMMGSSMGGLISCYTALRHQQVISKVACYSSAFLKRLVDDNLVQYIKSVGKKQKMKIHIDMGDNEFGLFGDNILIETKEVYDTLLSVGFTEAEVRNQVIAGGTHDEPSWRDRTANIIEWLNNKSD